MLESERPPHPYDGLPHHQFWNRSVSTIEPHLVDPVWRFREALVRADAIETLFARFDTHLKSLGYLAMGGQIVDASIIPAPRQRMTDEEPARCQGRSFPRPGLRSRQAAPGSAPARQCRSVQGPLRRRACLRYSEAPDGPVHPHHRPGEGEGEDRPRQHRI